MPYETTWSEFGVEWRYHGDVTPEETRAADREFYGDPRSDYAAYQLIDLRDVTRLDYPVAEQELTAAIDGAASHSIPGVRVAFIVLDHRFDAALEFYVERISRTSWQARIFVDADRARGWCERQGENFCASRWRRLALDR